MIISSSEFSFFGTLLLSTASERTSRGRRCRPSPPPIRYCLHFFLAHRVPHSLIVDFSSSVANLRSRAFRKSIIALDEILYEYALGEIRTHKADLQDQALEDIT